jgi:hypothetical protein
MGDHIVNKESSLEAGQHDDTKSVVIHKAFIQASLCLADVVDYTSECDQYLSVLKSCGLGLDRFYEIFFRYQIRDDEQFEMKPGFVNFERVKKGTPLATSDGETILADRDAQIFMPLYQSQGSEGFFAIRAVPPIFLTLSRWFRRWRLDVLLPLLPGIRWMDHQHASLIVDKRVTRIFAKQVFHLFGYRSRSVSKDFYILKSRDATSKSELYQNERWWKSARRSS